MPTPTSLAADVAAASLASIADEARVSCNEQMQKSKELDEHPGEGWRASAWLTKNKVTELVARLILAPLAELAGNSAAELAFFRTFGQKGSRELLLMLLEDGRLTELLADELWPQFVALATPGAASASELHAKFAGEGQGFELEYVELKNFFRGLEAVVGSPNPNVLATMRREHCNEVDSFDPFSTPNYKMTTTARIEWWYVEDPEKGLKEMRIDSWPVEAPETITGSAQPRTPLAVSAFDETFGERNALLTELGMPIIIREEFLGCRMYTGPCFVKYNTVLRGLQSSIAFFKNRYVELCKGNKYTTTLHVINSSIVKLSKLTFAAKVYRGVSGGRLPYNFRVANGYGVRGGVDPAFMSTTTDREVAMTYASSNVGGPGVVFSIQQGMVDRGADISWLSQYPHEREILFAPLGSLEIQHLNVEGTVLVPEVRLSINLNAATIEQVIGRRRKLLTDMGVNMAVEVSAALSGSGFEESAVSMLNEQLEKEALSRHVMWYNDEDNFKVGVGEVITAKRSSLAHEERLAWLLPQPKLLSSHHEAIVKLLRDGAPSVRTAALDALSHLTSDNLSPHTRAIVPLLRDKDELVRTACVATLGHVSGAALASEAPSVALILEHSTQDAFVRRAAINALAQLEARKLAQYAHPIVQRATDGHSFVRKAVVTGLGKLLPVALLPHAPALLSRLEDSDDDVRAAAVTTLGRVLPQLTRAHIDSIIKRTGHKDAGVRASALRLLGQLEPRALNERANVLVARLHDDDELVRSVAMEVLARLSPADLAAHTAAVALGLSDAAPLVRATALHTMGNLDKRTLTDHLPEVLDRLGDQDTSVRSSAVGTLFHKLDVEELAPHVSQIVERIEDPDGGVRRSTALWARSKLDPSLIAKHAHAIAHGLDDPILSVRRAALEALALTEPAVLAKYALPIVARLDDDILSVRRAAVAALQRLFPSDLELHTDALLKCLRDPEWTVRAAVVEALGGLPAETLALKVIQPHLLDAIEDAFDGVRAAAVGVLGATKPATLVEHAASLATKLEHPKGAVRLAAITILDSLDGPALTPYVKELTKPLEPPGDANKMVRAAALAVLARVGPDALAPHGVMLLRYVDDEDDAVAAAAFDAVSKADPSGRLLAGHASAKGSPLRVHGPTTTTGGIDYLSPQRKPGSMSHFVAASSSSLPITATPSKSRLLGGSKPSSLQASLKRP